MDMQFTVDRDLCVQCGACVDDCPFRIIEMGTEAPLPDPARAHHCIGCQHCLAVCPTGALSVFGIDPQASFPLPGMLPDAGRVEALLRGRRSVRSYAPEALEPELIGHLLKVAANAPTGKNRRACLFTVIERRADMDALREETLEGLRRAVQEKRLSDELSYFRHVVSAWDKGKDIIFRNAPHLLMVTVPPSVTTPEADAVIAMSYFELAACSRGVGVLWNAMIRWAFSVIDTDMYQRLGIPADHARGYAMLFGRPSVQYHRTVQRDEASINRVRLV